MTSRLLSLFRLASPMVLNRLGMMTLGIVDLAVVGQMASGELGFLAIAVAIHGPFMLIGIGFLQSVAVLVSQRYGAKDYLTAGAVWRYGNFISLLLGLVLLPVGFFGEAIFLGLGQEAGIAAGADPLFLLYMLSLPVQYIVITNTMMMESVHRPNPTMWLMILINVLNLLLNIALVGGIGPIGSMGAAGSATATFILRFVWAISTFWIVLSLLDNSKYQQWLDLFRPWRLAAQHVRDFFRIGSSAAVSLGLESSAFSFMTVMAGWISALALESFTVAFNILAYVFMIPLGLGTAASVLVGNAIGEKDVPKARNEGWFGFNATLGVLAVIAVAIYVLDGFLPSLITSDPEILAATVPLMFWIAAIVLFDGGQLNMSMACRATGDGWPVTIIHAGSYTFGMIPAGYFFAFTLGYGTRGLAMGIFVASIIAIFLLTARFEMRVRFLARARP